MTQDEIILCADASGVSIFAMGMDRKEFLRRLDAFAHLVAAKALAQPEQKPVGYVIVKDHGKVNILDFDFDLDVAEQLSEGKYPAYTTPPQRTWQGLTDEEIAQGCKESWVTEQAWQSAVWWAEAKLKEKNT